MRLCAVLAWLPAVLASQPPEVKEDSKVEAAPVVLGALAEKFENPATRLAYENLIEACQHGSFAKVMTALGSFIDPLERSEVTAGVLDAIRRAAIASADEGIMLHVDLALEDLVDADEEDEEDSVGGAPLVTD